jgi:hypothetical protein
LPVRIEDRVGSFLVAEIRDFLGKIVDDRGQLLMIG